MMLVTSGVVAGLAGAAALARLVESLLFGVHSSDAATLVASAAMRSSSEPQPRTGRRGAPRS
jgi:hypothetical protein